MSKKETGSADRSKNIFVKLFKETPPQKQWYVLIVALVVAIVIIVTFSLIFGSDKKENSVSEEDDTTEYVEATEESYDDIEDTEEYVEEEPVEEQIAIPAYDEEWKTALATYTRDNGDIAYTADAGDVSYCLYDFSGDSVPEIYEKVYTESRGYSFRIFSYINNAVVDGEYAIGYDLIGYALSSGLIITSHDDNVYVHRYEENGKVSYLPLMTYETASENGVDDLSDMVWFSTLDELFNALDSYTVESFEDAEGESEESDETEDVEDSTEENTDGGSSSMSAPKKDDCCIYTNKYDLPYSVKIPGFFNPVSEDGSNASFEDERGARIDVISEANTQSYTPEQYMEANYGGYEMKYAYDTYFVVSAKNGDDIEYRCYHVDDNYIYGFSLTYPSSERKIYEKPNKKSYIDYMYNYIRSNRGTLVE